MGPGKRYCGALSQPHSVCAEIETPKASRGRRHGEGCPLTIRLGVWQSIVSSPNRVWGRAPAENGFYAYMPSERSHLEHHFQYFCDDGAPKRRGAWENFPLSTGLVFGSMHTAYPRVDHGQAEMTWLADYKNMSYYRMMVISVRYTAS